jgi:hypothetical protein
LLFFPSSNVRWLQQNAALAWGLLALLRQGLKSQKGLGRLATGDHSDFNRLWILSSAPQSFLDPMMFEGLRGWKT